MNLAVIADDFTGANVTGSLLTAKGFSSATCLDLADWRPDAFPEYAALAVSMGSRLLSPDAARELVRQAVARLAPHSPAFVSKRIDSTLRGNLGAEIEGALAALDAAYAGEVSLAVVVPAFPASGRIVAGGHMLVHGIPLERTPIADDAATPVRHSSAVLLIDGQTTLPCGHIPLSSVLEGPRAVRRDIDRLRREGCRIMICDAVTDDDIRAVASSLKETPFPVLAVDPGPFTAEMAAVRIPLEERAPGKRVLAVIGSASELTRRQLEALRLARGTCILRVDCAKLLDRDTREEEIARVLNALRLVADSAQVIGICTAETVGDVFPLEKLSRETGIAPAVISEQINAALAAVAERTLACPELRIGGVYTSGGEVTLAVIRGLGSRGFRVCGQVLPLAVFGHLLGGAHPDMPMVTKGGFVGDAQSLVHCIEHLFAVIPRAPRQP